VEIGGLMAYGPNREHMFRRAAYYVHQILQGATPTDLPIEQPSYFDIVINLKTAQDLDLSLPREILLDATDVIK